MEREKAWELTGEKRNKHKQVVRQCRETEEEHLDDV